MTRTFLGVVAAVTSVVAAPAAPRDADLDRYEITVAGGIHTSVVQTHASGVLDIQCTAFEQTFGGRRNSPDLYLVPPPPQGNYLLTGLIRNPDIWLVRRASGYESSFRTTYGVLKQHGRYDGLRYIAKILAQSCDFSTIDRETTVQAIRRAPRTRATAEFALLTHLLDELGALAIDDLDDNDVHPLMVRPACSRVWRDRCISNYETLVQRLDSFVEQASPKGESN